MDNRNRSEKTTLPGGWGGIRTVIPSAPGIYSPGIKLKYHLGCIRRAKMVATSALVAVP